MDYYCLYKNTLMARNVMYFNVFLFSSYGYYKLYKKEIEIYNKNDNKNNMLQPYQCKLLTCSSSLFFYMGLYGIKRGYYDLATTSIGGAITSVLYWHNPTYGWRRTLDVNFIRFMILYHGVRAYGAENAKNFYTLYTIGIIWYSIEMQFYLKKLYWLFTYSHMTLHMISNTAIYLLYSGYIKPLMS